MTAASAALGAPATAAVARAMAFLATARPSLKAVKVAGSMIVHGCFGGVMRQSTTLDVAPAFTISTLRACVKSSRVAVAAALPTAAVTVTLVGAVSSLVFTTLARVWARAAGSSALAKPFRVTVTAGPALRAAISITASASRVLELRAKNNCEGVASATRSMVKSPGRRPGWLRAGPRE